jgi:tetratricopeptide (TPR) repeat protein
VDTQTSRGSGRYAAFLSYSHRDAAAARALHRRLEAYRIPRRLVGSEGERGPVGARLVPIFRDREELPAAGDLSEKVRAALADSNALVILCSPAAAASPWVGKEIDTFRALHPGRPIIAAILDGEPAEAFPPALCADGIEPLAADLRAGRDGKRLGLLKLVAGLSGVGVDALVQRDAQRRLRRVTAVTGVALAAVVAMAVLTAVALEARAEAQRQRAEAEGLVEFMLTDLRDRLKGVGRLDVLTAVNQRALDHYRRGNIGALPPGALERRARILEAMADDDEALGDVKRMQIDAIEARRTTTALLARRPDDPSTIYDHAQSEYRVGRVYELKQQWARALVYYSNSGEAVGRLVRIAPANADYVLAGASSAINVGNVLLNGMQEPAAAQRSYERAISLYQRAGRLRRPSTQALQDEANAYAWLADSFWMRSLWRQSLDARRRQFGLLTRLAANDAGNLENQYRLALSDRAIARSLKKVGERKAARDHLFTAYRISRQLAAHDSNNSEWTLFAALTGCDVYFADLGMPHGSTPRTLRAEISGAATSLQVAHNPRRQDLTPCLRALKIR